MTDICLRSAVELAGLLRRREIGCRELLDAYLARIDRLDGAIHAVVTRDDDAARARADAADAALARGEVWGPLHGLPLTIKDSWETAGLRTTSGAPVLAEHVPESDADAVAQLRGAGAVIMGKTNLPLFASDVQSYNALFPTTVNPWDAERTPGGSSGGAAAAVAMGFTSFELGSDIGGSIRTPANWCGIYGHKPTWGIVPYRGHVPAMPGTLSEPDLTVGGPMARSVDDLDLGLDVLAAPSAANAIAWTLRLPLERRDRLASYRVATWFDDASYPLDSGVRARLESTVDALRKAGVSVTTDVRFVDDLRAMVLQYFRLLFPILAAGFPPEVFAAMARIGDAAAPDDPDFGVQVARACTLRHRDWLATHEARTKLRARCAELFQRYDVLLLPEAVVPAIPHDHSEPFHARTIQVNGETRSYYDVFGWIALATMCHLPATVAPVGRTPEGLPVGIQIVGPHLEDRTTIHFARRLGDVVGGYEPPPGA